MPARRPSGDAGVEEGIAMTKEGKFTTRHLPRGEAALSLRVVAFVAWPLVDIGLLCGRSPAFPGRHLNPYQLNGGRNRIV